MTETLYKQLRKAEGINDEILQVYKKFEEKLSEFGGIPGFDSKYSELVVQHPQIDLSEHQKEIMYFYEENPVFQDSLKGKISIEDTLNELSVVNKGIRKILPRRKNKAYNERIEQVGELIKKPDQLKKRGLLIPDNLVTSFFGANAITLPILHYLFKELDPSASLSQVIVPYLLSEVGPIMVSLGFQEVGRGGKLPFEEAKYVDEKIKNLIIAPNQH